MKRAVLVLTLASACSGGSAENLAPVAHLSLSADLVAVNTPVVLDGSDSLDADGTLVSYTFVFSDGTPEIVSAASFLSHSFPRGGRYEVQLIVTDDQGATDATTEILTVTEEPPGQGCLSDDECRATERCDGGRCVPASECSDTTPCAPPLVCDAGFCRCPAGTAQCGDQCLSLASDPLHCGACDVACDPGIECQSGRCGEPPTCMEPMTMCGDACVDTSSDPENCGGCGNPCDGFCCGGMCWVGGNVMACPDGTCADIMNDPLHCGGCDITCDTGFCTGGTCQIGPAGTIIATFPSPFPATARVTGLTRIDGEFWALVNGRRIQHVDPTSGMLFDNFLIDDEPNRRAFGACQTATSGMIAIGAFDRFNPLMALDFETYDLSSQTLLGSLDGEGGPCAYDAGAGIVYVFANDTQELVTLDATSFEELSRTPVSGLDTFDSFSDLALDGYGGLWAVRPQLMGFVPPLMYKIDIAGAFVSLTMPPIDMDGLGGVVLVDGVVWAAGQSGFYEIVP